MEGETRVKAGEATVVDLLCDWDAEKRDGGVKAAQGVEEDDAELKKIVFLGKPHEGELAKGKKEVEGVGRVERGV